MLRLTAQEATNHKQRNDKMSKTVIENEFTIINLETGATVSFNHQTKNIRYASVTGAFFDTSYEDDNWVQMMNQYKLWR